MEEAPAKGDHNKIRQNTWEKSPKNSQLRLLQPVIMIDAKLR